VPPTKAPIPVTDTDHSPTAESALHNDDDTTIFDSQETVFDLGAAHDFFLDKLYLDYTPSPLPTTHPSRALRRACSGRPNILPRPAALSSESCVFCATQVVHFYTQMTIAFAAQVAIFLPGREDFFDKASWFRSQEAPLHVLRPFCSGAGIGDFGLQQAGFVVLRAVERESVDRWSYLSQFGIFPEPDMLSAPMCPADSADLLSFGLPCEISSSAGTQAGLTGTTDKAMRTMALFHNFIDRLATEAPRSALLENVLGLRYTNQGADFDFVLRHIRGTGFVVGDITVGSSDLGSAQRRPRIYLLILRADIATHSSCGPSPTSGLNRHIPHAPPLMSSATSCTCNGRGRN
jgi:hypothetical protein